LENLFEVGSTYSIVERLRNDLNDDNKLFEAEKRLMLELLKKKVQFDLFGKFYNN
jgi:hypothetical protein